MTARMPSDAKLAAPRASLLRWYRKHRRDLPWRRTSDPYAVWVSEIMLQQTRVETVGPYYERFLARFPDVGALAAAEEDDVLGAWSGLGYYRRARSLHRGARVVEERFEGRVPREVERLREIPGIGRYTAGAIASIAFGVPAPILDGNVRRVLSRFTADAGDDGDRALWDLAAAFAEGPAPGDLNQGLMELGATVCRPRAPLCEACPIATACVARRDGTQERFPPARERAAVRSIDVAVGVLRRGRRILLERPPADSPLRGRWDLPAVTLDAAPDGGDAASGLAGALRARYELEIAASECASATHGIMNRRLRIRIVSGTVPRGRTTATRELRWIDADALDGVPVSGATHKVLRRADDAARDR